MGQSLKIGYQGIENSYNHIAVKKYIALDAINAFQLFPLLNSKNVVEKLIAQEIDLGVMALTNSNIGEIEESKKAINGKNIVLHKIIELEIVHGGFKLSKGLSRQNVQFVASHPAALAQCSKNIVLHYPNAGLIQIENTALGPLLLLSGKLNKATVVICSHGAGTSNGLFLDAQNLSDTHPNVTTFGVYKRK